VVDVIGRSVKAGASLEETFKQINQAKEFSQVPKEDRCGFLQDERRIPVQSAEKVTIIRSADRIYGFIPDGG
jgi:hypothetical protein